MKKIVITSLFILRIFYLPAQSTNIDSLQKALAVSKADTNQVLILRKLADIFALQGLNSALIYTDRGIKLSKELKYLKGEALCLITTAEYYRISGNSAQGMHYAMRALPLFEKQKDVNNIILCNLLISWTLEDQEYPRLAVNYVLKITPIATQVKSQWLGYCYTTLCLNYTYLNILDSALIFGLKADTLMPNDDYNISSIGNIYLKMHEVSKAEKYLNKGIANYYNKRNLSSHTFNILSNLYYQKNLVDSAIYFAKKAFLQSKDERHAKGLAQSEMAAAMLKELYEKKGMKDSMFFYMQTIIASKDKVAGQERENLISLLFNEQSQHQEIETRQLQYEKRVQIFSLLAVLTIFLLISLVLYRHDRQKQKANKILEKTLAELRSTQAQLIQSEKMASLGELTAGIAHEIQNPLNFVNNFSEVNKEMLEELKAERLKPKAARDENLEDDILNDVIANSEKITHHGKRADAIVKGMLQHSQTNNGQNEPTDINKLVDEYLRHAHQGLRAKDKSFNAILKTDYDESIDKIIIIPQDIGKVLLNLYNNAFYAVDEKFKAERLRPKAEGKTYEPTVSVSTKRIGDKVFVSVKDNGDGIPQKIVDKIFQPFFTTKPTGQGTGLGLSLSYDIIKAHGGEIKVETKEAEGSVFSIILPLQNLA